MIGQRSIRRERADDRLISICSNWRASFVGEADEHYDASEPNKSSTRIDPTLLDNRLLDCSHPLSRVVRSLLGAKAVTQISQNNVCDPLLIYALWVLSQEPITR